MTEEERQQSLKLFRDRQERENAKTIAELKAMGFDGDMLKPNDSGWVSGVLHASETINFGDHEHRCCASIDLLLLPNGKWIQATDCDRQNSGYGSPLTSNDTMHPTRNDAIRAAIKRIMRWLGQDNDHYEPLNPKEKKLIKEIEAYADSLEYVQQELF